MHVLPAFLTYMHMYMYMHIMVERTTHRSSTAGVVLQTCMISPRMCCLKVNKQTHTTYFTNYTMLC